MTSERYFDHAKQAWVEPDGSKTPSEAARDEPTGVVAEILEELSQPKSGKTEWGVKFLLTGAVAQVPSLQAAKTARNYDPQTRSIMWRDAGKEEWHEHS